MTFEELRHALAARARDDFPFETLSPAHLPPAGLAHGAVLVPLLDLGGAPAVLFTKRRFDLRRHAGEVCFPGGRIDEADVDTLAAALRETAEEIGLPPGEVDVLGRLDETLVLRSAFRLTPWVARVPHPFPYAPHPGEVERILFVPLGDLARPGAHRTEHHEAYGRVHEVHFFDVGGETIWGATARILSRLLQVWKA
jgi:8-oxo-dGTP pyrophosphatase MutT (NUDIX family)